MKRSVASQIRENRSRTFLPLLRSNEPFILMLLFYKLLPEFTDVCTFMGFYTVYTFSFYTTSLRTFGETDLGFLPSQKY